MLLNSDILRLKEMVEDSETGLAAVNERLESAKTQIDTLKTKPITSALPIGTVIQSFLTSESFQSEYGDGWMLCDGSSCEGTAFAKLSKRQTLPDLRGKFLRTIGGKAANLGLAQDQATAVNGLKNAQSKVTGGSVEGEISSYDKSSEESDGKTSMSAEGATTGSCSLEYAIDCKKILDDNRGYVGLYGHAKDIPGYRKTEIILGPVDFTHSHSAGSHDHSIEKHSHVINHKHDFINGSISGDRTAAAQTMTGDTETRPENVSVNTFIRVD